MLKCEVATYSIFTVKAVWHEIFSLNFFQESLFSGPLSIPLGPFRIFSFAEFIFTPVSLVSTIQDKTWSWKSRVRLPLKQLGSHRLTAKLMLKDWGIFAISNLNVGPNIKPKTIRKNSNMTSVHYRRKSWKIITKTEQIVLLFPW
jgi:hypothetical protein